MAVTLSGVSFPWGLLVTNLAADLWIFSIASEPVVVWGAHTELVWGDHTEHAYSRIGHTRVT